MIPKFLLLCLVVFWGLFLCTNISVHAGLFGSWIAYPFFISLAVILIVVWQHLFRLICDLFKHFRYFKLNVFLLLLLATLSILAYGKWCFKPSENIMATVDSGMYFSAACSIANNSSYTMEVEWPAQAPESLKKWLLGQNYSEAQRRNLPGPKYWNFITGYFFIDQNARSGAVAIPFPNGYPTLLASTLKTGGPNLAFCLNTILHWATSALFGLLAFQYLKHPGAAFAVFLMLFFPLSVWSANHLYAEPLLSLAWLSSILAWSYRDKVPIMAGILTSTGPGLGLLIKIDALLGVIALILLLFEFRKRAQFTLSASVSFLLCAGWAAYSNASFARNYIKDTLYALWETSPIAQYPVMAALASMLALFILILISIKSGNTQLAKSSHEKSLKTYSYAALKLTPWALVAIFIYLYFVRPDPICSDTFVFTGNDQVMRSYREETFFRFSWFFSPVLFWIGLLGTAFLSMRIKESWQIAFYSCGLFSLLFFSYDVRCDPYQPYCMRRFATYTNPLLLLGIVSGLTVLFELKKTKAMSFLLVPSLLLATAIFLIKDTRIYKVTEMEGFFEELSTLAQKLPDDGILFIPLRSQLSHFSAPLRFVFEKEVFNVNPDKRSEDYVNAMQTYLSTSHNPVYLLTTSPVDFLGFPVNNAELRTDSIFKTQYLLRNYKTPSQQEKDANIHYYLFKLPTPSFD
jgi:hypothetical protein